MLLLKKSWKISSEDEKIGSRGGRCAGELRRPQPSFFLLFFFCLFIASFNRRFCQQIVNQMQFWCHTYLVGYFPYHALVKHGRDSICKFAVPILARIQRRGCDWASVISTPPLLDQTSIQFNSILTLMKPAGIGERSTQCSFFQNLQNKNRKRRKLWNERRKGMLVAPSAHRHRVRCKSQLQINSIPVPNQGLARVLKWDDPIRANSIFFSSDSVVAPAHIWLTPMQVSDHRCFNFQGSVDSHPQKGK